MVVSEWWSQSGGLSVAVSVWRSQCIALGVASHCSGLRVVVLV